MNSRLHGVYALSLEDGDIVMISKAVCKIKMFSDDLDDFKGFIGKSVPCTPTFVGYFLLKNSGFFDRKLAQDEPLLMKADETEVVCCVE